MYGLPQASILANKQLTKLQKLFCYYQYCHLPGLQRHKWQAILFTLMVDNFGTKYKRKQDVEHLLNAIQTHYEVSEDWMGFLYFGIMLNWCYEEGWMELSIPGYIRKALMKFQHPHSKWLQYAPYKHNLLQYGAKQQMTEIEPELPKLSAEGEKRVQQVVGTLMFYSRQ
eukprot:8853783-Ditylum_brightwellii.AAC.1